MWLGRWFVLVCYLIFFHSAYHLIPLYAAGLKIFLPSQHHSSFTRLFSTAGQCLSAVFTLWIGGHLENYFFLWSVDLLKAPIFCFPPSFYSITKRQVIGSYCNSSSLWKLSVNFQSPWKKGWDKIWIACRKMLGVRELTSVFCCTELPTGSQLGVMVSLGKVRMVRNFPLRKLGVYYPGPFWNRTSSIMQFIWNSPSTVLVWGRCSDWELWVYLTALNSVEAHGYQHSVVV